jgi:hypothetical protein
MPDYQICGWHIRSAIPLPEAAPWENDARDVDVEIRLGTTAGGLREPVADHPEGAIGADGGVLFTAPGVGRYLIRDGREVVIEPSGGADAANLRTFLYGTVLGVLCHQRGLLPLHAGAVAIGDRAIIVAGDSGAGKSSLTAALVRQGARLLAEDLCPLRLADAAASGKARVLPGVPRFRLNRDVAEHLRLVPVAAGSAGGPSKIAISCPPGALALPSRPAAIYGIDRVRVADNPRAERIAGIEALEVVRGAIFRWELAHAMGRSQAALRGAAALASAVPCFRLWRTRQLTGLDETAALILERETVPC